MNILIINDDGYNAKGIKILTDIMKDYGQVYIVAPHYEQSGKSNSFTLYGGIEVYKHKENIYSVEGTPTDCLKYALFGLKLDVDLVISGINNGENIGIDTIYSGTIGGAMNALFHRKKTIAVSTSVNNFEIVKDELKNVLDYIFNNDLLSLDYLLNINFPKNTFKQTKGMMITDLDINEYENYIKEVKNKIYFSRKFLPFKFKEETDLWAFENGYISITPLKLGNGDKQITELVKSKVESNNM